MRQPSMPGSELERPVDGYPSEATPARHIRTACKLIIVTLIFLAAVALSKQVADELSMLLGEHPFLPSPFYVLWISGLIVFRTAHPELGRVRWLPASDRWSRANLGLLGLAAVLVTVEAIVTFHAGLRFRAPPSPTYLVGATILAPLTEEWLFRGVLWNYVAARFRHPVLNVAVPALITATLFAWWHVGTSSIPSRRRPTSRRHSRASSSSASSWRCSAGGSASSASAFLPTHSTTLASS